MNSPVSRIEMLGHCMERWAATISDCLAITLAGLLLSAQNVFHAVLDLVQRARRRLQLKARLSRPMAKLEAIGRHCELFRHNLPASVGSVYALAQKPPHEMDLRGNTRSQILVLLAAPRTAKSVQRLMAISVSPGVVDATKIELIAEIKAAIGRGLLHVSFCPA